MAAASRLLIAGILPECPGGLESQMTVAYLFTDRAGSTPILNAEDGEASEGFPAPMPPPHPPLLVWPGPPHPATPLLLPPLTRTGQGWALPPSPAPSRTPVPLRNEPLLCLTISWPSLEPLRKQLNWTNISCLECLVSLTRWCPGEARGGPLMGTPGWWACPLTHWGKVFALGWRLVVYCELSKSH